MIARFTIVSNSNEKLSALESSGMEIVAGSVRQEQATGILIDLVENKCLFVYRDLPPFNDIPALNDYYLDTTLEELGKIPSDLAMRSL